MSDLTPGSTSVQAIPRTSSVDPVMRVEPTDALHFDALHPGLEPPDTGLRSPLLEPISVADIERFRGLVYASPISDVASVSFSQTGHSTTQPAAATTEPLTPADRIAGTLAHLRDIRGL